jgi:CRP/FNR family transcriptional regulator, cyclic AMP receptor protein
MQDHVAYEFHHWNEMAGARTKNSLNGIPMFAVLSVEERGVCEQCCSWRSYSCGKEVINCASTSRDVFFVIAGSVRVTNQSPSGREVTLADLQPGDFFGELAAIDGEPRSATVVATSEAHLAVMAGETLRRVICEHPAVALAMLKRLASTVRNSTARIMELSTLGAHNRVYAEILRMAKSNVTLRGDARIKPPPTHSEIAARISTTRETVARAIGDLGRQGIVSQGRGTLVVTDLARLADLVEHFRSQ